MFADVAFPISRYLTFTYQIPKDLLNEISVGVRVKAPLGKRIAQGIVVSTNKKVAFRGEIRSIISCVDDQRILDAGLWRLIKWLSSYYMTPIGMAAKTALPSNLTTRYKPPTKWKVKAKQLKNIPEEILKNAPIQGKILKHLLEYKNEVYVSELGEMASSPLTVCRHLSEKGFVDLIEEVSLSDVTGFTFQPIHKKIKFSKMQLDILDELKQGLSSNAFHPYLLHGVTGSGKTEIYVEIARQVLEQGKTVIMLLPEISLTPQIAGRFRSVFGDTVALWHSKLNPAARSWTWKQICAGKYQVVIGARSAIFAPLKNLGLVVVDEEQESSYKQSSPAPRYHARDVALMRGKIHNAMVVLASATPSFESYYNQIQEKFTYLHLSKRYGGAKYPVVHVVDMVKEQEESGKIGQTFSGLLFEKIEDRLKKKEQIILLQNRRGYSPVSRCDDCGEMFECPQCRIPLTYHRVGDKMQCHICDKYIKGLPVKCDHCQGTNIKLTGVGTQKVEETIQATFPKVKIARLDTDTAGSGASITKLLERFSKGEIDILLGTQMIAKGLDFENATLVGVINGDAGLFLPDFRSGERVFQLIYQASGRSGRRQKQGEVVLQTWNADNPVIKHATKLDLKTYYNIALSERQALNYPPFSWMARIVLSGKDKTKTENKAKQLRAKFSDKKNKLNIFGPTACYREWVQGKYRTQIVIKSSKNTDPNGLHLHHSLQKMMGPYLTKPSSGISILIDIDPTSLM